MGAQGWCQMGSLILPIVRLTPTPSKSNINFSHFLKVNYPAGAPPGTQKELFGPNPLISSAQFFGNSFRSKYRLVGCPDCRSGMPGSFSTVIAHMEPPSSRKQAKRVRLGPERTLLGPWRSSEGPGKADLIPTTPN